MTCVGSLSPATVVRAKPHLPKKLSAALRLPFIEMDALFWDENWTPTPDF
jgi:hypothetical protein